MTAPLTKDQIRLAAEGDLRTFIRLIHPDRCLGSAHEELLHWWTREEASSHQLVLLPRDHQKSALLAYRVAHEITKNPAIRVLYISSTANLATKQLKFIKDILTCEAYKYYWPNMVNEKDSEREKWTEGEISVDHPSRKAQHVRDPTVFTAGLTTNITGMHCDIAALDDVVVDDNAYTDEGRDKVRNQASYLASIAGTESQIWAVGTRYHPKDLYADFQEQVVYMYDDQGTETESYNLWETYQREAESRGDGTGEYLWPRQQNSFGNWYGFNQKILATKKAQYTDPTKFSAQYYNNPNDISTASISREMFQHYDKSLLSCPHGQWSYNGARLNVFAAVDFAFSLQRRADYTSIVVVGCDARHNYYVLDVDRFKTQKISEYFSHILKLHTKWGFRKIRAEVSIAQEVIVKELKENYIRAHGLALSVDEFRPTVKEGSKAERVEATLQPKYANRQVWHYIGGGSSILEEELVLQNPPHDDVKDSLASCLEICVPPTHRARITASEGHYVNQRFGGIG